MYSINDVGSPSGIVLTDEEKQQIADFWNLNESNPPQPPITLESLQVQITVLLGEIEKLKTK